MISRLFILLVATALNASAANAQTDDRRPITTAAPVFSVSAPSEPNERIVPAGETLWSQTAASKATVRLAGQTAVPRSSGRGEPKVIPAGTLLHFVGSSEGVFFCGYAKVDWNRLDDFICLQDRDGDGSFEFGAHGIAQETQLLFSILQIRTRSPIQPVSYEVAPPVPVARLIFRFSRVRGDIALFETAVVPLLTNEVSTNRTERVLSFGVPSPPTSDAEAPRSLRFSSGAYAMATNDSGVLRAGRAAVEVSGLSNGTATIRRRSAFAEGEQVLGFQ